MRVAVVGAGTVCQAHLEAFQQCGVHVAALCDLELTRARNLATIYRVRDTLTDWRNVVDRDDIDLIDVCTTPRSHGEIAVAALQRNKHVICEKPIASTLADADRVVAASSINPGTCLVVHQLRLQPLYQKLKYLIDRGHLGRINFARVLRLDAPPAHLIASGKWGKWRESGGGVLINKGIHELDILLGLLGPAKRAQGMMGTFHYPIESEDHVAANVEFESGAIASICIASPAHTQGSRSLDILGDRGSAGQRGGSFYVQCSNEMAVLKDVESRFPSQAVNSRSSDHELTATQASGSSLKQEGNTHTALFENFFERLRKSEPPIVTVNDGRASVELCVAIYAASISGEAIYLPIDETCPYYSGISLADYRKSRVVRGNYNC